MNELIVNIFNTTILDYFCRIFVICSCTFSDADVEDCALYLPEFGTLPLDEMQTRHELY